MKGWGEKGLGRRRGGVGEGNGLWGSGGVEKIRVY